MALKIGSYSTEQYHAFLNPPKMAATKSRHWVSHLNLMDSTHLSVFLNRLADFLLNGFSEYPTDASLFEQFKSHDFTCLTNLADLEKVRSVFKRFLECGEFSKTDLDRIENELNRIAESLKKGMLDGSGAEKPKESLKGVTKKVTEPEAKDKVSSSPKKGAAPDLKTAKSDNEAATGAEKKEEEAQPTPPTVTPPPPPIAPPPPGGKLPPKKLPTSSPGVADGTPTTFVGEPSEPPLKPVGGDLQKFTKDQLENEIKQIEDYLTALAAILDPIDQVVKEEKKMKEYLDSLESDYKLLSLELKRYQQNKAILSQIGDCSILKLSIKEGEVPVPFLSDDRHNMINSLFKEKGIAQLSSTFLRSSELDFIKGKIEELQESVEALKALISETKEKHEKMRAATNNGIPMDRYENRITDKNKIKDKWKRALKVRQTQLDNLAAPQKAARTTLSFSSKNRQPTILEAIEADPTLLEKFPELTTVQAFYSNPNAQILIRGEQYHQYLKA